MYEREQGTQDEEDDEDCSCVAPYTTMSTLLQLKAMKNKLNVAYLGSEMMKWNSSSTEIELKKIAVDILNEYKNFAKDQGNAYLMLARCRYFNQEFYRTVLEGVKNDQKHQKLPFLFRGGQAIQEAQQAWSKLLKSYIKMAELRTNFVAIENAYKRATKRGHIIDQIVVPKTQATIKHIRVELEEIDREESHRIKMTLNKMLKCKEAKTVCHYTETAPHVKESKNGNKKKIEKTLKEPLPQNRSLIEEPNVPSEKQYQPVILLKDMHETINRRSYVKLKSQQVITSLINFYELVDTSNVEKEEEKEKETENEKEKEGEKPKKRLSLGDCNPVLDPSMNNEATIVIADFLEVCKDARDQLDNLTDAEEPCKVDSKLINNLQSHIDAVIHTNNMLHSTVLTASVRDFVQSCGKVDIGLRIANKDLEQTPLDESGKKIVNNLVKNIDDVVKMITECKNNGLLTPSLEEFSIVFNEAKEKINDKVKKLSHGIHKNDYFNQIVSDIETLTSDIRREGMESINTQQFLKSCKDFKKRLEERKKLMPRSQRRIIEAQKDDSFITESIVIFVMSCEDYINKTKNSKHIKPEPHDKIISKISELMIKWQREGILSKSTMEFMRNAKNRWTIDSSRKYDTNSQGRFILSPKDESVTSDDTKSVNISTPANKTIRNNLTSNSVTHINNDILPENSTGINKTNDKSPTQEESPRRSIFVNKKVEKSVQDNLEFKVLPVQSDDNEYLKQTTQYPSKCKDVEVYTRSRCCKFSQDTSVSLFSKSDENDGSKQSEMIVAEISTYDSCPVFETSYKDIWLLETCTDSQAENIRDSTSDTSESVDTLNCLVYDKEKSAERSMKETYTM